jgi:hypothetical protein
MVEDKGKKYRPFADSLRLEPCNREPVAKFAEIGIAGHQGSLMLDRQCAYVWL